MRNSGLGLGRQLELGCEFIVEGKVLVDVFGVLVFSLCLCGQKVGVRE